MRITANDVRTRAELTRLLVKMENNPEYSRQIGVEDKSRFRSEVANEKEVEENVELIVCHSDCDRFL